MLKFSFLTLGEEVVDFINDADLWNEKYGVKRILGRCCSNNTEKSQLKKADWAYMFHENSEVSLSAIDEFPHGFPRDFSILIIVKLKREQIYPIFTIYSEEGNEQLSVVVGGPNITIFYNTGAETSADDNFINFEVGIDDEK